MIDLLADLDGQTFTVADRLVTIRGHAASDREITVSLVVARDGVDITDSYDRIIDGERFTLNPVTIRNPKNPSADSIVAALRDVLR